MTRGPVTRVHQIAAVTGGIAGLVAVGVVSDEAGVTGEAKRSLCGRHIPTARCSITHVIQGISSPSMIVQHQRHSHIVIEVIVGWHMEDVISANLTLKWILHQDCVCEMLTRLRIVSHWSSTSSTWTTEDGGYRDNDVE